MKIKRVSVGYNAIIQTEVVDRKGQDLSALTFKFLLQPVDQALPDASSSEWEAPGAASFPELGTAIFTSTYTEADVTPGDHWLWMLPPDGEPHRLELIRFE